MIVVFPPEESALSHQEWIMHVDIETPWGQNTHMNLSASGAEGPSLDVPLQVAMYARALREAAEYIEQLHEERTAH